uniref:Probable RNA 2'-phosphotransferase n=1 Tax=Geoglobus ahangari TaxID=113653 RepID=A0A7J3TI31_9EURY
MDIGYCEKCGFFEGKCKCGNGRILLDMKTRIKVSKFLSGLLRHYPEKFRLNLDKNGFADLRKVLNILKERYGIDEISLRALVHLDKKGRFEIINNKIRAKYGHTVPVNHRWSESGEIPPLLYHGTSPKNLESILRHGLLPMKRREVHLSETVEDAIEVGKRYSEKPVILMINAKDMIKDGYEIRKKGRVYTTDFVLPKYISILKKL